MEKKGRVGTIVTIILCVVLLAVAGLFGFLEVTGNEAYQIQKAANAAEIERLQTEFDSIKESDVTTKEVEAEVFSAADAGTKVADLQNLYRSTVDVEGIETIASSMDKYLDKESLNWRVPWYAGRVSRTGVKWKFETTYSFTEKSIPVLWTCRDANGTLLAYATGNYMSATKLFADVSVNTTAVGANSILPEDGGDGTSVLNPSPTPDIFGIVDGVVSGSPSPSPEVSGGDESSSSEDDDESSSEAEPSVSPNPTAPPNSGSATASLDDEGRQ